MKKTLVSLLCIPLFGCDSTNLSYLERSFGNLEFNSSIYTTESYSSSSSSKKPECKKKNKKSKCVFKYQVKPIAPNSQKYYPTPSFTKYGGNTASISEKYVQNNIAKKLELSKKRALEDKYKKPDYIIEDDEVSSGYRDNNVERARSYRER